MDFKKMEESYNKKIIEDIKEKISKLNKELHKKRDKKRYIVQCIRSRTITTKYGTFTYERYIYKYYNTELSKWVFINFVDNKIGVTKNRKLHDSLVEEITAQIGTNKRYRDILDQMPAAQLTTMTISRIYRSVNYKNKFSKVKNKVILERKQNLYINVDDGFVPVIKRKNKKKQRVRMFTYSTGKENVFKSRVKLINKRVAFMVTDENTNIKTEDFVKEIVKYGKKFYENFEDAHLILGGDGATWIKNAAYGIGAEYVLDKFHAVKYLKDAFILGRKKYNSDNWTLFKTCKNYFENGMFEELMEVLNKFADKATIRYFKNNKRGILSYGKEWNVGVSAEADISSVVKSTLGYGSKIYNWRTFNNIINEKAYLINNYGTF